MAFISNRDNNYCVLLLAKAYYNGYIQGSQSLIYGRTDCKYYHLFYSMNEKALKGLEYGVQKASKDYRGSNIFLSFFHRFEKKINH